MKTKKMRYVWFLVILCIFCLFLARTRSKVDMEIEFQCSVAEIVVSKREIHVRTTNDSNQTVVLSEALWNAHYCCGCQKGQAQQADFDRLLSILSKSSLEGTQLMSWKQTISNGKAKG